MQIRRVRPLEIFEKYENAYKAFNADQISQAIQFTLAVETDLPLISDHILHLQIQSNLGGLMIDLGNHIRDKELILRGKNYIEELLDQDPKDRVMVGQSYNLANGYFSLWTLERSEDLKNGRIDETFLNAKKYYRRALDIAKESKEPIDPQLLSQINTNFGNCLRSIGRFAEAFHYYDEALKYNPNHGEAMAHKAITLRYLSKYAHGYSHKFLLESHRLLKESLDTSMPNDHLRAFQKEYDDLTSLIQKHGEIVPEKHKKIRAKNKFHQFSRDFCVKNQLFLTPATFIGRKNEVVYGDPMFISTMIVPLKGDNTINRYITFLNQIKQDFVLARYFLIQSQYQSTIVDCIDQDVILYDPVDYSIHNSYAQLLKMSLKLTVDTFDKIAQFLREYCNIHTDSLTETNFRNIWKENKGKELIRPEFIQRQNKFILALYDLSLDLQKGGYFEGIYRNRNTITHRFLIVHEMRTPDDNSIVTSRININDLVDLTIKSLNLLKAAIMYLIMFIDIEERKKHDPNKIYAPISSIRISKKYQWKPYNY
jgi:tetratricopeptide (TPR) repeat protein